MRSLIQIIESRQSSKFTLLEMLKLNKQSNVIDDKNLRDVTNTSTTKIDNMMWVNPRISARDKEKMDAYHDKGSKPERLAKSNGDDKLVRRWMIAIERYDDWEECWDVFRKVIIDRGIFTADELDCYVLKKYAYAKWSYGSSDERTKRYERYLDKYNVKHS